MNYCSCSFTCLIFVLNCITGSNENYASHCSNHVYGSNFLNAVAFDAVLRPTLATFIWNGNSVVNCRALSPLHSYRLFIKILSSLLNVAMLTGSVTRNFQNSRYFRCLV